MMKTLFLLTFIIIVLASVNFLWGGVLDHTVLWFFDAMCVVMMIVVGAKG